MSNLDIPYLADQEIRTARQHATPHVPPAYTKGQPSNSEAVNNYYYNIHENLRVGHWFKKKRCFYGALVLLAIAVVAGAVVTSVVLTREPEGDDRAHGTGTDITTSTSEVVPSTVLVTITEKLSATSHGISSSVPTTTTSSSSSLQTTASTSAMTTTTTTESSLANISEIGNLLSSLLADMSTASSSSTVSSISTTSSAPASVYTDSQLGVTFFSSNGDDRQLLIWQNDDGDLVATESGVRGSQSFRIKDQMAIAVDQPKYGTPLAAASDSSGAVHVFYLSDRNFITHILKLPRSSWVIGGVAVDSEPVVAHEESRLSATWHQSKNEANVLALSYQTPLQQLRLLMSDQPQQDNAWYKVGVEQQLGYPQLGRSNGLGHAISSGWRYPLDDDDAGHHGLLGVVEGERTVLPWECAVDFRPPPARHVECYWLNDTFGDMHEKEIQLSSSPMQFSWLRITNPDVNPSGLAYEFSLLSLSPDNAMQDSRLGVGLPRKLGTDFGTLDSQVSRVEAMAGTDEGKFYARNGRLVFEYELRYDDWAFLGWVNTTLTETMELEEKM